MREADKILLKENRETNIMPSTPFVDRVAQFVARNEVQCILNGLFKRVQCSLQQKFLFNIYVYMYILCNSINLENVGV